MRPVRALEAPRLAAVADLPRAQRPRGQHLIRGRPGARQRFVLASYAEPALVRAAVHQVRDHAASVGDVGTPAPVAPPRVEAARREHGPYLELRRRAVAVADVAEQGVVRARLAAAQRHERQRHGGIRPRGLGQGVHERRGGAIQPDALAPTKQHVPPGDRGFVRNGQRLPEAHGELVVVGRALLDHAPFGEAQDVNGVPDVVLWPDVQAPLVRLVPAQDVGLHGEAVGARVQARLPQADGDRRTRRHLPERAFGDPAVAQVVAAEGHRPRE
mmetsp:Transcript_54551/g.165837  ORF Transcript_54551/g.165837 Transcript_54551/m.165837 type:complete len:272 (-) Transcript_54551:259-1074(-)